MQSFSDELLTWYDKNRRALPWRLTPHPYYILVSEFMLQQTRMDTVLPYFDRFITALPRLEDLAAADEAELLKLWEGLGYYRRVRNLSATAKIIMQEYAGEIPADPEILKRLPGIGDYIAGAIASTAYQVRTPAIDGNVLRIMSRLSCHAGDLSRVGPKGELQALLLEQLPDERVGDFNQSLMELGALICLPNGAPLCADCPIQAHCCAYAQGNPLDYPLKLQRKPPKRHQYTVLLCESLGQIQVERFGPGLLEGLNGFPMLEGHWTPEAIQARFPKAMITPLPAARHIFSHLIWEMIGYRIELPSPQGEGWIDIPQLDDLAFPVALQSYREQVSVS